MHLDGLEARLRALGFVRARKDYQRATEPRLVIGCFRTRKGYWPTLHAVVWDPITKERFDPSEYDTFARKNAIVDRCIRRLPDALPIVTGVSIPAPPKQNPVDATLGLAA